MAANEEVVALNESLAWSAEGRGGPVGVEILDGTVLLTVEGDSTDHILSRGEAFESPARRWVAAAGLSPSRIRVTVPEELPILARLAGHDAGRLARHLLGGALVLAVWVSLWTWVAMGVVGPLSTLPQPDAEVTSSTAS
jgi:hypothetical protein